MSQNKKGGVARHEAIEFFIVKRSRGGGGNIKILVKV